MVYSGSGFLNGSILCYHQDMPAGDGSFRVAPYFESVIEADERSKRIYDANRGAKAQRAMMPSQYPKSQIIEPKSDILTR